MAQNYSSRFQLWLLESFPKKHSKYAFFLKMLFYVK